MRPYLTPYYYFDDYSSGYPTGYNEQKKLSASELAARRDEERKRNAGKCLMSENKRAQARKRRKAKKH